MALATVGSVCAELPNVNEDPLTLDDRIKTRILMLTLLETPARGATAQDYLMHYGKMLRKFPPEKLLAMFPEKEFNVFTLLEYLLNFVKVIMVDPKEFTSEVSHVIDYFEHTIPALKELMSGSQLDEEEASRVEACFQDIVNAVEHSKQLAGDAVSGDHMKGENYTPWPPFLPTLYSSYPEKEFMTGLSEIQACAQREPCGDLFQDLDDVCRATDLSNVTNSDILTYAAMQMMISLAERAISCHSYDDLNCERYKFLLSSTASLNSSTFPHSTVAVCFRDLAVYRITNLQALLERAHISFCYPSSNHRYSSVDQGFIDFECVCNA